ncbi:hypothetical protein DUNSADRAFT_1575 [Dunaliella salina]|uniref:Encoded protein n=1 Tax=Dunaliella salina TaxID=3046 RepID=A0ABQ7H8I6_DUNSA|nr:hypothetical protein DUNSADRAFT_1575 [Dunaliella salina]|eukprot:KAF5843148.1 hypothetical protein DUNSADRAFT_1575 [Dunaliella salina]
MHTIPSKALHNANAAIQTAAQCAVILTVHSLRCHLNRYTMHNAMAPLPIAQCLPKPGSSLLGRRASGLTITPHAGNAPGMHCRSLQQSCHQHLFQNNVVAARSLLSQRPARLKSPWMGNRQPCYRSH